MKAFLCHSSDDSAFVIEVAKHLRRNLDEIYYFEDYQRAETPFIATIWEKVRECEVMIVFAGQRISDYQINEACSAFREHQQGHQKRFFVVRLDGRDNLPDGISWLDNFVKLPPVRPARQGETLAHAMKEEAFRVAKEIVWQYLHLTWRSDDDLPLNPYLFDYEKRIIDYFMKKIRLDEEIGQVRQELARLEAEQKQDTLEYQSAWQCYLERQREYEETILPKQLEGCPAQWPEVVRWKDTTRDNKLDPEDVGEWRPYDQMVVAAALSRFHDEFCMRRANLCFPEAGPRKRLIYPRPGSNLRVGVIVSGGIAPGTNSVIDGITQRHQMYAQADNYHVEVLGLKNGFQVFDNFLNGFTILKAETQPGTPRDTGALGGKVLETSQHAGEGGSVLGTSRYSELTDPVDRTAKLQAVVSQLYTNSIDILYIIGGDGSMKAAHAIWSTAQEYAKQMNLPWRLSVVAIPKTMDNDILWVWQTFGFLSAVERARELIEDLSTEVASNPRLCVVQLFGSDSGFVVSHAVLASRTGVCDAALIPEVDFTISELVDHMRKRINGRCQATRGIPYGLVVLAETAIPQDALDYVDDPKIGPELGLSDKEKDAVRHFHAQRLLGKRIEGQTDDQLRTAGLKIVSQCLRLLLPTPPGNHPEPAWNKLRVFTNEPRHLLRATPPRTIDIITAQRLGMLAVDNAMAGYTDFMVSQWLTEYVLVPLKLVVLGRKRIPNTGIFWKSVVAKTGQPSKSAKKQPTP